MSSEMFLETRTCDTGFRKKLTEESLPANPGPTYGQLILILQPNPNILSRDTEADCTSHSEVDSPHVKE